ncbi:haloalkane dehalogenase [Bacterioplanoides sp.]|uniref:haloalkane dehalogenase n=1 Tax=Bacterioplanoides sp. TaxID=2066072 RepID=UPI003AFFA07E
MKVLRTPEHRFENLPDYPFAPNYCQITDQLRMHYVDEGPRDGQVILMLHGEPSWSYLYRFMIPVCVEQGYRVIAPDLIGFGKSDKPGKISDYSYRSHLDWVWSLVEALDLNQITLVCQDWGGLLGLRLAADHSDRFKRIAVGNSMLPTGDLKVPKAFKVWKNFALFSPWFPIGKIINAGTRRTLSDAEVAAYDAPFPSGKYKAGTRAFPRLVPVKHDMPEAEGNRNAWQSLEQWHQPFLTTFSSGDPIMRGGEKVFQKRVPGCNGQNHVILKGGHFLQEDSGVEFARAVCEMIAADDSVA